MAPIIKLRRFSLTLAFLMSGLAFGQSTVNMPRLSNVGIIPVQWQGGDLGHMGLNAFRVQVERAYPEIVRASNRFRVLNDKLVEATWSTPDGRAELVADYELHGFMNLMGTVDGDVVRLQMRLLGPDMQIYLLEEEVVGIPWVKAATQSVLNEKLKDLTFRLINRLPIDVSVLAVQGRYVTLSGGKSQGLRLGDAITILRPSITQVHPANGAWTDFSSAEKGKGRIVDLNENTAIMKLTAQTYEDAVAVGDGAKIYNIPGRVRFARMADENKLVDHGPPLVSPPKQDSSDKIGQRPPPKQQPKPTQPDPREDDWQKQPTPEDEPREEKRRYDDDDGSSPNIVGEFMKVFRGLDLYTGIDTWKVTGGASASSAMAPWLLNYFAGFMRAPFAENMDLEAGGALHLGKTGDGSYTGFDLASKLVYLIPTQGFISYYRVGGLGRFESRNISGESFGGGDYILGGGLAGLEGRVRYVDTPLEWYGEIALIPIGIGQLGYEGSKKTLGGVFGYEFELGIVKPSDSNIDLGGTLNLSSIDMDAGDSFTRSSTKLLVHARYKF